MSRRLDVVTIVTLLILFNFIFLIIVTVPILFGGKWLAIYGSPNCKNTNNVCDLKSPSTALCIIDLWMMIQLRDLRISLQNSNVAQLIFSALITIFTATIARACYYSFRGRPTTFMLYFMRIVLLLEMIVSTSIYVFHTSLNERFERGLNESIVAYRQDNFSYIIDTMQSSLQCCGSSGYANWLNLDPPENIPLSCNVSQRKSDIYSEISSEKYTTGCYNRLLDIEKDLITLPLLSLIYQQIIFVIFANFLDYLIVKLKKKEMVWRTICVSNNPNRNQNSVTGNTIEYVRIYPLGFKLALIVCKH
ncbi:hypothetical protein PUN28_010791 [Cardiocondyla obscurior]|uniref:Tetraspanin n=1 Tax=Cardiocondyla obscurior TaxID=286306 RepID=A0AAW2FKA5_9HYME